MLRQANRRVYPTIEYTEDDWRRLRYYYYRLCEKVDAEIGVLLNGLRDLGLEEETYIIFTSDHGDGHGAHQLESKKPAFMRKSSTFLLSLVTKGLRGPVALTTLIWFPSASICCPRCAMSAVRAFPMASKG